MKLTVQLNENLLITKSEKVKEFPFGVFNRFIQIFIIFNKQKCVLHEI